MTRPSREQSTETGQLHFERTIESATAWLFIASVQLIARRIESH